MQIDSKTLLCRYRYDALDRLVANTPSAQADSQRFYLKDRLATEIQGAEQRSIMQHEDQLLAQQQRQSGTVETRLFATDQQRSVLNVLGATSLSLLAYSPYGHRHPENGLLSLLGFNGERPDPVTGCYLLGNGYRAFNPVLMRFASPDSWSPFGKGGINAYAYCVDPVNFADPTGHFIIKALSRIWNSIPTLYVNNKPTHIQKTGGMKNVKRHGTEIYSYEDKYKGTPRLNILAHGARKSDNAAIVNNHTFVTPKQLHSMLLEDEVDLTSFDNIRTLVCFSGEGGKNSFSAQFSKLTNKPVKGYIGTLTVNTGPELMESTFNEARIKHPNKLLTDVYDLGQNKLTKTNPYKFLSDPFKYLSHNYKSIRFSP